MMMSAITDPSGIYGGMLHYGLVIMLVGLAFLAFFYCWMKGCLSLDEEAKIQMMHSDEPELRQEDDHDKPFRS